MAISVKTRARASLIAATFTLTIAACASGPGGSGEPQGVVNAGLGSRLADSLPRKDRKALGAAFAEALSAPGSAARAWRGDEARGEVTPGRFVIGGLGLDDDPLPIPKGLYLEERLETDLGLHALTNNVNVRNGPSTSYRVLEQLDVGAGVNVIGRVVGKPWNLVELDGRARGYVHENLMIRAPGMELELAGGPTRTPKTCREFEQRLTFQGRTDRWAGVACETNGRWTVEPPRTGGPTILY
ncbi:MAG: SH3 domain-containing protein [Pseudomonadota bacterium]